MAFKLLYFIVSFNCLLNRINRYNRKNCNYGIARTDSSRFETVPRTKNPEEST